MWVVVLILGCSVCCGAVLGGFCQLYYAVKNIVFSWNILSGHALAKRQAMLGVSFLPAEERIRLNKEVRFLSEYHNVPWKRFLRYGYDILFAFQEMEESLPLRIQHIFSSSNVQGEDYLRLEEFWARDNLFAFETTAYEQAVESYMRLRDKPTMRLSVWVFRFLDLPHIQFHR